MIGDDRGEWPGPGARPWERALAYLTLCIQAAVIFTLFIGCVSRLGGGL